MMVWVFLALVGYAANGVCLYVEMTEGHPNIADGDSDWFGRFLEGSLDLAHRLAFIPGATVVVLLIVSALSGIGMILFYVVAAMTTSFSLRDRSTKDRQDEQPNTTTRRITTGGETREE